MCWLNVDASKISQVVKGEMLAKATYQRSAEGPVVIGETGADGKYIEIENTGRKVSPHTASHSDSLLRQATDTR
jgi:hypothetical protein